MFVFLSRPAKWVAATALASTTHINGETTNQITAVYDNAKFVLDEGDLTSGPGSDLINAKLLPGSFCLNVAVVDEQNPWEIDLHLQPGGNFPPDLQLFARVSQVGSPVNSTIEGGRDWVLLSSAPQALCRGSGSTTGIGLEFMIGNLSLTRCAPTLSNLDQWLHFTLGAP